MACQHLENNGIHYQVGFISLIRSARFNAGCMLHAYAFQRYLAKQQGPHC